MARSFLTTRHERWLFENFKIKTNQELADILTEMVAKDNEDKICKLEAIIKDVTQKSIIKSIQSELRWRKSFKGFTASYIKHAALRLKCGRKSFELVSVKNREKAQVTNIKRWSKIAIVVDAPATWLTTFRRKEVRICQLHDKDELKRFRNAIFYFNRNNSNESGYFFSSNHISEANLLRVSSNPIYNL